MEAGAAAKAVIYFESKLITNSRKDNRQSPAKKVARTRMQDGQAFRSNSNEAALDEASWPNKLSEDVLKCLVSIYSQTSSFRNDEAEAEALPSVSGSCDGLEEKGFRDPYGICSEFGRRDIGPYKHFLSIEPNSVDQNLAIGSSLLTRRLTFLFRNLALVELSGLTHQQKVAFWINIYNSCMMNAFLEHGMPANPQMVVVLMPKAMVNVGGHLLRAMTI